MAPGTVTPNDQISICNIAISLTGQGKPIGALDEGSTEANLLNQFYNPALEKLLACYEWGRFSAYANLGLLQTIVPDPNNLVVTPPWKYVYAMPADCAKFWRISNGLRNDTQENRIEYEIGDIAGQTVIYTDQTNAVGEYTYWALDPGTYSSDFVFALASFLSVLIAPALTQKEGKVTEMMRQHNFFLQQACVTDQRETRKKNPPLSGAERARGGSGNRYGYVGGTFQDSITP